MSIRELVKNTIKRARNADSQGGDLVKKSWEDSLNSVDWSKIVDYVRVEEIVETAKACMQGDNRSQEWEDMWEHLYGQSDVDDCSILAMPFLVSAADAGDEFSQQALQLAGSIELLRSASGLEIPSHAAKAHSEAIVHLRELTFRELSAATTRDSQEFLVLLAIAASLRGYPLLGKALSELNANDLEEEMR